MFHFLFLINKNKKDFVVNIVLILLQLSFLLICIFNSNKVLYYNFMIDETESKFFLNFMYLNYNFFPISVWIIDIVLLLCSFVFNFNWLICLLLWWISISFVNSTMFIVGGDQIRANIYFLIFLYKLTRNFSHEYTFFIGKLVVWLVKFQVAFIYFQAAISKFASQEWSDGTALYYWITDPVFGMGKNYSILNQLFDHPIFLAFSTWAVLLLELGVAFGCVFKFKIKNALFLSAIVFHFMIIYIFNLPSFGMVMISVAFLAFYLEDEVT